MIPARSIPLHGASQATLFEQETTEELAARLRVDYERLEPHRKLMAKVVRCCQEELRAHGIEARPHDVLAAAEDFMLTITGANVLHLPDALLRPALHDHVIATCREAASKAGADAANEERWEQSLAAALMAAGDVLARAATLAAERLGRQHAISVTPSELLIATGAELRDLVDAGMQPCDSGSELERRLVARMVTGFLAGRPVHTR